MSHRKCFDMFFYGKAMEFDFQFFHICYLKGKSSLALYLFFQLLNLNMPLHHLLYAIIGAWIVKNKEKIHQSLHWWVERKGMITSLMLSIVTEVWTRIPKNIKKDPLNRLEEIRKIMFTERATLSWRISSKQEFTKWTELKQDE